MLITLQRKIKSISILDVLKIGIIIFASFSLVANFLPYYNGGDDYDIAIAGIILANGTYGYTNELWQETGTSRSNPQHWLATTQNVLVPISSPGIVFTSAFSYLIAGYYGLFYLGPIFTILFLIVSERISTKLFGSFVGLITLVFLVSNLAIFLIGRQLLTDNVFALFSILGIYYLIKFFHEKKDKLILISSIFFVLSAFFRFNGLIFLPIEVLLVVGYFVFQNISTSRKELISNNILTKITFSKINSKRILKISALMILPWLSVFLFYFSFNDYYFGDPFTSYYSIWGFDSQYLFSSFFIFDSERFDSIEYYSISFLPDLLRTNLQNFSSDLDEYFLNILLTIFSFFILGAALIIALYRKSKRSEIIVLISFVLVLLLFYSSDYVVSIGGQQDRFMIPAFVLTYTLIGFLIVKILKLNLGRFSFMNTNIASKSFKIGFLIVVGIFLFLSLIDSESVKATLKDDLNFNNPQVYANRYPLEHEGFSEKSIIVETKGKRAMEYNVSPFIPVKGTQFKHELDINLVPPRVFPQLERLLVEGYDAYTFKEHTWQFDPFFFRYLEAEHGIILKDYSKTFCKMHLIENVSETSENQIKSDDICYMYRGEIVPKN